MRRWLPKSLCPIFLLSLASAVGAYGQVPAITSGGVVNAASWSSPLAPGEIVAIFGTDLATGQQSATAPLPITLGGTSVSMNGVAAPLVFVSPTQINAQVPSSLPVTGSGIGALQVTVTTAAGTSPSMLAGLTAGVPGLFTADASGCGPAAALNVKPDGSVSLNSPSNSAAPGDYIALFGTGFGLATQQPPDGTATIAASTLQTAPSLFVDSNPVASLSYSGLAPGLVGVDQINFQVPAGTRNGCSVPVLASQTLGSPSVTVAVQAGRGQCSDPPIQAWGQISLSNVDFVGTGTTGDTFSASFPSGPNAQPPAPEAIVYAPDWVGNVSSPIRALLSAVPIAERTCPVPGYSDLSAGAIQIQPASGPAIVVQPLALPGGGVVYSEPMPAGFIVPGAYTISGTPGSSVSLNAKLVVGSPIQIQTPFAAGTVISSSQPLTVQWTGGDAGSLVRVALYSEQPTETTYSYAYANAASGSLTISPSCTGHSVSSGGNGVVCSFGLPLSANAQVSVQVMPNPANATTVVTPGITGPVQLTWEYSYYFSGLVLGQ